MKKMITGMVLILALAAGMAVNAEPAAPDQVEIPSAVEETAPDTGATDALQDAMDAYRKARQTKRVEELEAELDEYVAAGTMTQEQADLILKDMEERQAKQNGECPNCGYQFEKGGMRRGRGQRGNARQMPGGAPRMNGGNMPRMNGMSGATPQQQNGVPAM